MCRFWRYFVVFIANKGDFLRGGKIVESNVPNYLLMPASSSGCAFFRICNEQFSVYRWVLGGKSAGLWVAKRSLRRELSYLPYTARRHWTVYSDALFSPAIL